MSDAKPVLKPCPFCGGEPLLLAFTIATVVCKRRSCQSEGPSRTTRKAAIAAWNRRATGERGKE